MQQIYMEPKNTYIEYAEAVGDIFAKTMTVVSISSVLIGELLKDKIKERKE